MSARKPTSALDRLSALIDYKLTELEARMKRGEVVELAELNALRRLIAWRNTERETERTIELSRGQAAG